MWSIPCLTFLYYSVITKYHEMDLMKIIRYYVSMYLKMIEREIRRTCWLKVLNFWFDVCMEMTMMFVRSYCRHFLEGIFLWKISRKNVSKERKVSNDGILRENKSQTLQVQISMKINKKNFKVWGKNKSECQSINYFNRLFIAVRFLRENLLICSLCVLCKKNKTFTVWQGNQSQILNLKLKHTRGSLTILQKLKYTFFPYVCLVSIRIYIVGV